jgi:hypothetical protein
VVIFEEQRAEYREDYEKMQIGVSERPSRLTGPVMATLELFPKLSFSPFYVYKRRRPVEFSSFCSSESPLCHGLHVRLDILRLQTRSSC